MFDNYLSIISATPKVAFIALIIIGAILFFEIVNLLRIKKAIEKEPEKEFKIPVLKIDGQKSIEENVGEILFWLKDKKYKVAVDGGATPDNLPRLINAGVDIIYSGQHYLELISLSSKGDAAKPRGGERPLRRRFLNGFFKFEKKK